MVVPGGGGGLPVSNSNSAELRLARDVTVVFVDPGTYAEPSGAIPGAILS